MQNKVIQTSNMKQKKEKETSKTGLAIINTILTNNIELSKHKSHEIYGQYSPSNLTKENSNNTNNNNITSNNNNQKKNYTLANTIKKIIHYSGVKKTNTQNETKNTKSKSKKEYGNININDISNQMNNNNKDNLSENKNEINKAKKIKLDNILSESDSVHEIDSMEEESLTKGVKYSNKNLKGIHNMKSDSLNYKRHLTTGMNNPNNKNSEISMKDSINKQSPSNYKNKNKISGKKKTKKLKINDDNEDTDEEIIVNDNEFDNSRFISNDKLIETTFPKLSSNPFIGQKKPSIKSEEFKKSISSKEYGPKIKNSERPTISSHHIKSTTLGTIIQSNTNHNSNNLSNTIDFLNFNLNNNLINNPDEIYKSFLLTAKNGDKEKFLEILGQINSLPENIKNINYQDENGFSALHYSCDEGNIKIVEILLKANCDTNIKNKEKKTPLHLASKNGYFDISKKLIAAGALLNILDSEKNTPLHYVCMIDHVELFRFFLSKLPKADTKNIYGKRPIDLTHNKEIKEDLIEYMKKNENSYHKIKIYQTTDLKMKNLIEKQKHLESNDNKDNKRINTSSKKSKNSSLSPNSKKKKNKNQTIIRTQDYNSVQNTSTTSTINKKRTINVELKKSKYINIENINETNDNINMTKSNEKISPKKGNNNKINSILKTSDLKTSTKSKDSEINNNKKNQKVHNQEQNTIKNNHIIKRNHLSNKNNNNLLNYNNKVINVLKKTKTVEQFSSGKSNNNLNQINLTNININHSNKRNETLNDSKLNNTNVAIININNSINNELNKINLSFNSTKNEKTKLNKSKSKENKQDNSNNKISPENKSKVFNNKIIKKKLILEEFEIASNVINLNKTQEKINNVSKISKQSLKNNQVLNQNKSKDNKKNGNNINYNTINNKSNKSICILDSKEKNLSGSQTKKKQKHTQQNTQHKKLENTSHNPKQNLVPNPQSPHQININLENSYTSPSPTNSNISKISPNKKSRINFESLDKKEKNNIADQTLQDNIHSQLNLNSIEEEERITPSSFICLAQLGKGSFGEVYLVQKINTKEKFAMKVLRKERIMGQNLLRYAIAERNVLSLSNHPFIVKLNFAFQTSSKLFLILEYCSNGDLAKHLLFEKRFSEERAKFYICEVLLALENLHQRDIIFRDLKPDNVVLDEEGHCKLTDFGLSKEGVTENQSASSFCGSVAYLAPEMIKKQGHGKAVDWYLLGVLLYEMLVGITPFFTNRKEDIFHNIEFGELKLPEFIKEDTKSLLRGLLQKDPRKRLGGGNLDAEEIKQHPYFKDVNWDDVYYKRIPPPPVNVFTKNIMHVYQKPRLFANDDNNSRSSDKSNPNMLPGWSFINNEE